MVERRKSDVKIKKSIDIEGLLSRGRLRDLASLYKYMQQGLVGQEERLVKLEIDDPRTKGRCEQAMEYSIANAMFCFVESVRRHDVVLDGIEYQGRVYQGASRSGAECRESVTKRWEELPEYGKFADFLRD